ncbi:MFS transporter [Fontibacillus phaseoli]|uniref:MFS transporter n=1 Tax=Fontibacillus phaseoli TaxID=1416533 RepID=A0A369B6R6_9BACL|nr:MFS transporter [Fontibacillus phaseoli]RCX17025.1 MFS transporter [Fontibacillus phaseoli]
MFKRSFYYLWGSQTLSNTVDVLYIVALTTYVLKVTGSVVFATLVPFLRVASQLFSGLIAPLMISRYRLPFLLTLSQFGQFLLFVLLAGYLSPMFGGDELLPVYVLIVCISFLDGWTTPARNALVPRLVSDQALLKANGLIATTDQIVQFAGWAISGLLVATFGSFPVLVAVAVGYGFAMAITVLIEDPTEPKRRSLWDVRSGLALIPAVEVDEAGELNPAGISNPPSRWDTLKEGWVALWRSPRLRSLTLMDMTDMLGGSVWAGAFMLVFVNEVLLKDEQWWGYINASYFAGAVIGGILVVALVERLEKRIFPAMLLGMLGYAVLTVWFALNDFAPLTLLIVLVTGPFTELAAVSRRTLIQRSASPDLLPKVFSAQATLLNTVFGLSLLFMSGVAEWFGIVNMYLFAAAISMLAAGVGWLNRRAFASAESRNELSDAE